MRIYCLAFHVLPSRCLPWVLFNAQVEVLEIKEIFQSPLTAKIKIVKYSRNTLNHETPKIFNCENFLSYGISIRWKDYCVWCVPWFSVRQRTCASLLSLNLVGVWIFCYDWQRLDMEADLVLLGVRLNMPPFLKGKQQLSIHELVETKPIAALRNHVERSVAQSNNFHMFDRPLPASFWNKVNQVFLYVLF